ncbi:hypothetical protein KGM_215964 [Danaus plexippus plexippus]|uniref:Uncharacterized protein n=1 Tax=Danaus plexippus plexippus TaxID=278856 RepID=A0A212EVJ3_DANPL|nr:hypothetical protein KGM_215964 [Danaus plexippus plexippus]
MCATINRKVTNLAVVCVQKNSLVALQCVCFPQLTFIASGALTGAPRPLQVGRSSPRAPLRPFCIALLLPCDYYGSVLPASGSFTLDSYHCSFLEHLYKLSNAHKADILKVINVVGCGHLEWLSEKVVKREARLSANNAELDLG